MPGDYALGSRVQGVEFRCMLISNPHPAKKHNHDSHITEPPTTKKQGCKLRQTLNPKPLTHGLESAQVGNGKLTVTGTGAATQLRFEGLGFGAPKP